MQNISEILYRAADNGKNTVCLVDGERRSSYQDAAFVVDRLASAFIEMGLAKHDRVAIYMDKSMETVAAIFAACAAGLIAVPINPKLKAAQVEHILRNSGAAALMTTSYRLSQLSGAIDFALTHILLAPSDAGGAIADGIRCHHWDDLILDSGAQPFHRTIDVDPAAILYTSGSTGNPKGVVISHRNLYEGACSVNRYLGTREEERILSLLPLSFDAGLSQITTAFQAGATVVLHNYLQATQAVKLCEKEGITSITAVPPLWTQLAGTAWPQAARAALRVFATTGGHMPARLLEKLRILFPRARPFLMYGLTESFRSTYLDPREIDSRPGSIGKAIPNAEILVLREDGMPCGPNEVGELVHRGALVTLGYWQDPEKTAERFKPLPARVAGGLLPEYAVWSGDYVKTDEDGFIYFVGRRDEMIKSSGYRISPTEIESVVCAFPGVKEAVALGISREDGDQEVVALVVAESAELDIAGLRAHCRKQLPTYMTPRVVVVESLPRSPNGKLDRAGIKQQFTASLAHAGDEAVRVKTCPPSDIFNEDRNEQKEVCQ